MTQQLRARLPNFNSTIATAIALIKERSFMQLQQQREISAYTEILAGLKFDKNLIRRFLRGELMRESVIYQEIQQEALQRGVEQGQQQGEATLVLRQLARRLGQVPPSVRSQIQQLRVEQLEELGEALLDFDSTQDLMNWLTTDQG